MPWSATTAGRCRPGPDRPPPSGRAAAPELSTVLPSARRSPSGARRRGRLSVLQRLGDRLVVFVEAVAVTEDVVADQLQPRPLRVVDRLPEPEGLRGAAHLHQLVDRDQPR